MRSHYFIRTLAASFQKNISTLQLLHNSRSSSRHWPFHCQRGYGKLVFACLVRGGDYIMCEVRHPTQKGYSLLIALQWPTEVSSYREVLSRHGFTVTVLTLVRGFQLTGKHSYRCAIKHSPQRAVQW